MTRKYLKIPNKRFVLTKRIIEDAVSNTHSNKEAARWLDVSYNTYKKWAKYYGVFEQHLNPSGKGIKKVRMNSKYNLDDVLKGNHPNYSPKMLKKRLIDAGYMQEECSICKWNEERITNQKICLHLDFLDSDESNFSIDNLRLLCPNCYFTNVGDFRASKYFCF